jgi:hypothetical protein
MCPRTRVSDKRTFQAGVCGGLLIFGLCIASGQVNNYNSREATFNVDSRVVLVPATVLNRKGALVGGLSSDAFRITQDNTPRPIVSFWRGRLARVPRDHS